MTGLPLETQKLFRRFCLSLSASTFVGCTVSGASVGADAFCRHCCIWGFRVLGRGHFTRNRSKPKRIDTQGKPTKTRLGRCQVTFFTSAIIAIIIITIDTIASSSSLASPPGQLSTQKRVPQGTRSLTHTRCQPSAIVQYMMDFSESSSRLEAAARSPRRPGTNEEKAAVEQIMGLHLLLAHHSFSKEDFLARCRAVRGCRRNAGLFFTYPIGP